MQIWVSIMGVEVSHTTCIVVKEKILDHILWPQKVQYQISSEQDRKADLMVMSAKQAHLMVYYLALFLKAFEHQWI